MWRWTACPSFRGGIEELGAGTVHIFGEEQCDFGPYSMKWGGGLLLWVCCWKSSCEAFMEKMVNLCCSTRIGSFRMKHRIMWLRAWYVRARGTSPLNPLQPVQALKAPSPTRIIYGWPSTQWQYHRRRGALSRDDNRTSRWADCRQRTRYTQVLSTWPIANKVRTRKCWPAEGTYKNRFVTCMLIFLGVRYYLQRL